MLLFTTGLLHVLWLLPHVLSMILFVVQSVSHVQLFVSLRTTTCQASLSLTISWSLPRFMAIESVMLSTHLILCCPLVLLPSIFPSIRVFSNESGLLIRWTKYWSFSISPSIEYSGLISFRIDWFDLLAVQGTLESFLAPQFESSFSVVSLLYGPPLTSIHEYQKTIPLTIQTTILYPILFSTFDGVEMNDILP